jgi:phosphoglycolate phosphatase-like HAD superfamily hydrolase
MRLPDKKPRSAVGPAACDNDARHAATVSRARPRRNVGPGQRGLEGRKSRRAVASDAIRRSVRCRSVVRGGMPAVSEPEGRSFDAVVFDLDGTLVDTTALHIAASHYAARAALRRDVSAQVVNESLGWPLPESMAVIARGAGLSSRPAAARATPRLIEAFLDYYAGHQDELARAFPGVPHMLATLRRCGYPLGLLSNKLRDWGRAELAALELAPYFAVTVFAEDMPAPKPAGSAFDPILAVLGQAPERILLVGDGVADVGCARAAGAKVAAALWGVADPAPLLALAPDYALRSLDTLLALCGCAG